MSLQALIAEDEAPQREELVAMLREAWPELRLQICGDGLAALEALDEVTPDLAFLDIRMPGADGFTVARALPKHCVIAFTTAYDEHAVAAFELGAIDYVLKPVRRERLLQTLQRMRERLRDGQPATLPQDWRPAPEPLRWISASIGDSVRLTPIEEVLAFHAQDKYTRVLTATGEALVRVPLKDIHPRLDAGEFAYVHRSLIVRIRAIELIRKDELGRWQLRLRGVAGSFPVSQGMVGRFRDPLG